MLKLNATARTTPNNDILRSQGLMPAVFYGRKEKSTSIAIPEREFSSVWKKAGETSIISLESSGKTLSVLIHDVAVDPVKGTPVHADFYVIEADKALEIAVPLEFVGVSGAVKDLGGTLVKALHELMIEALPKDLPHSIEVDISALSTLDSQIHVSDIKLPAGVTSVVDADEVVAAISVAEEEPAEPVVFDAAAIEMSVEKGKKEEEGEAEAESEK
jgi:large subunit ribosomal protein L25